MYELSDPAQIKDSQGCPICAFEGRTDVAATQLGDGRFSCTQCSAIWRAISQDDGQTDLQPNQTLTPRAWRQPAIGAERVEQKPAPFIASAPNTDDRPFFATVALAATLVFGTGMLILNAEETVTKISHYWHGIDPVTVATVEKEQRADLYLEKVSVGLSNSESGTMWVLNATVTNNGTSAKRVPNLRMRLNDDARRAGLSFSGWSYQPAKPLLKSGASFSFRVALRKPAVDKSVVVIDFNNETYGLDD